MIIGISITIAWALISALGATLVQEVDRAASPNWFKSFGFFFFVFPFMALLILLMWVLKVKPTPKAKA